MVTTLTEREVLALEDWLDFANVAVLMQAIAHIPCEKLTPSEKEEMFFLKEFLDHIKSEA